MRDATHGWHDRSYVREYALTPRNEAEARLAPRYCALTANSKIAVVCGEDVRMVEDRQGRGFWLLKCVRCGLVLFANTEIDEP